MNYEAKKILFVKLFSIGDVLNSTPAIMAVRREAPKAKLYALVGKWSSDVLKNNPYIDELIEFDDSILRRKNLIEIYRLIARLRKENFDIAIILHRSIAVNLLIYLCRIPLRYGMAWEGKGYFLTHYAHENRFTKGHEIERYLKVVSLLKDTDVSSVMKVFPTENDRIFADNFINNIEINHDKIIGICPGGAENPGEIMPIRRWPVNRYDELISFFLKKGYTILVFGGRNDKKIFAQHFNYNEKIIDLVGKTSLLQTASLMKHCKVIVSHDNGLMHLAAASGVPVVSVFGPTNPLLKAPIGEFHRFIYTRETCSPCYLNGKFPDCKNPKCMESIIADDVIKIVEDVININSTSLNY